jgi:hypothetical protein
VGALPLSDGRVLRVTANHPIYLPDQQRYADAGELTGDERLLALGAMAQTSSLVSGAFQASADAVTVFNITVAGEHNYFAEGVLVHNKTPCTPKSLYGGTCHLVPGCLDPMRPTNEFVTLNQNAVADAGPGPADAGPADSGLLDSGRTDSSPADAATLERTSTDAGVDLLAPNPTAPICAGGSSLPSPSYLAFDIWNTGGQAPAVAIYASNSGNSLCFGSQIGEVWFQSNDPPLGSVTTQCIRVPPQFVTEVTLTALNAGTMIRNPRFVSGCACPRQFIVNTNCGYQGSTSGFCS